MKVSTWKCRPLGGAATIILCVASVSFAAQWYKDYEDGIEELEKGRFAKAVTLLECARESGPEPGDRVRFFGMKYDAFYPNYYLGKAYHGLGDLENALDALEASKRSGELKQYDNLAFDREQLIAELRPPDFPDALRKKLDDGIRLVESLIARGDTEQSQRELSALSDSVPEGSIGETYRQRIHDLEQKVLNVWRAAQEALDRGRNLLQRKQHESARSELKKAREVDVTRQQAETLLSQLETAVASAAKAIAEARVEIRKGHLSRAKERIQFARRYDPNHSGLEPLTQELELALAGQKLHQKEDFKKAQGPLEELLRRDPENTWARQLLAQLPPRPVDSSLLEKARKLISEGQVKQACKELDQLPPDTPELADLRGELQKKASEKAREAVVSIFRGKRGQAIADLEDARAALTDRPMVCLYLAMAYHREYLRSGEKDKTLDQRFRDAVRETLRIDHDFQPNSRFFSPRLIALVDEMRTNR